MQFNLQEIYKKFDEVKSAKEYTDYVKDILDNANEINRIPFDETEAANRISVMIGKYGDELNWIASVYGNGMTVVTNAPRKNESQLKQELIYTNNQIPIIALKRELTSYAFKKYVGIE